MEITRLKKILEFNSANSNEIRSLCNMFYDMLGREQSFVIPDIQAVAKVVFTQKNYMFVHIPMDSMEIGAYQLKLNGNSYLVVNTSKSLANNNFAVAHELYHLLTNDVENKDGCEVYLNTYDDNYDEQMANAFAGNILMPRDDFSLTSLLYKKKIDEIVESSGFNQQMTLVLSLMSYYKTTYMSVVIRCFETGIFDKNDMNLVDFILKKNDESALKILFDEFGTKLGIASIMNSTRQDDFEIILNEAEKASRVYMQNGILTEEDYKYRMAGLKKAYRSIKGKVNND